MKKTDLIFIASPFLLTGLFIVIGYNILITSTPEARVAPPPSERNIEILQSGDIQVITPHTQVPASMSTAISPIPDNQAQLEQLLNLAQKDQIAGIFLTIPVTVNPDNSLQLTNASLSSDENIMRWAKTTISAAHSMGLHIVLAFTLNATETLSDLNAFKTNYYALLESWTAVAAEYGVAFFVPGLTIGHPLYSKLDPDQVSAFFQQIQAEIRQSYNGKLGVGLCCTLESSVKPGGYSFLILIPTGEVTLGDLAPQAQTLQTTYQMTHVFEYDRNNQRAHTSE